MNERSTTPEMLTAEDLQNFGFTRSMAYNFLNREDVPVIRIGKRKFIRKENSFDFFGTITGVLFISKNTK